jgi:uncharacterized protein (TIGR01777 family)
MAILITGATGLIGRAITQSYLDDQEAVHVLTRNAARARAILGDRVLLFEWQPGEEEIPPEALTGVTIIFHLMGEPVSGRWTQAKGERIIQSRVVSTQKLARAVKGRTLRFISASSFGIYPGKRGEIYEETEPLAPATTRVQQILRATETAAASAATPETRVNIIRFGMVCAKNGYPKKLTRLFKRATGFVVSDGEQIVPVVDIEDATAMLRWVASGRAGDGPVNCVAPELPRFKDVADVIASNTNTALRISIPSWLARPLLGGSADYFLLSYDVRPRKALDRGYNFRQSDPKQILKRAITGP